jgi:hypothetical protein
MDETLGYSAHLWMGPVHPEAVCIGRGGFCTATTL